MAKLNLVPNEVVGYRLYPDQWNWTIVVVKRYGKDSKTPGVEYEQAISYPSTPQSAVKIIVDLVTKLETRKLQDEVFDKEGIIADFKVIATAMERAEQAALWTLTDLENRLRDAGYTFAEMKKSSLKKEVAEAELVEEPDSEE